MLQFGTARQVPFELNPVKPTDFLPLVGLDQCVQFAIRQLPAVQHPAVGTYVVVPGRG